MTRITENRRISPLAQASLVGILLCAGATFGYIANVFGLDTVASVILAGFVAALMGLYLFT